MSYQQEVFNVISSFTGHNANYVVPKEFMRLLKDSNSALILSQLVYWTGKQTDPAGWIYKSYKEWDEEIFLSQKTIMTAVKKLKKLGIVDTAVRKIRLPGGVLTNQTCVHYRIDQDKLAESIIKQLESLGNAEREFPGNAGKEFPGNAEREFPSINTKITSQNDDNVPAPPPESPPKVSPKVAIEPQGGESSSSFSENDLVSILATLMPLVPEQHQKPSVEKTIEKGLITHTEEYIRLAILYTIANSNGGTWQKFKAYLGKCIDNDWHNGWEPEATPGDQGPSIDFGKIPDSSLKQLADTGNQQAIAERERRTSFDKLFKYK